MMNYSSLEETQETFDEGGVLVHVAEPTRARWNHIEDLDDFFSRMYQYHQRHGFVCMLLQEVLELLQYVFVLFLTSYLIYGINYPILFKDIPLPPTRNGTKVTLHDVVLPFGECVGNFTLLTWVILITAILIWMLKMIKGVYHMFHFWDIKQFYNTALKIDDNELDNLTWHEVQTRVRTVQMEQQMCIHKLELTELDIYHRILRQQNYLVAMVNKQVLPPKLKVPFLGEVAYWSAGLHYNIQFLFFWSPWSPFQNPWELREDYKKPGLRHELAAQFGRQILWLATVNLVFAPLIFVWQILYAFFSYAAVIRKEPSVLAVRRWSLYGKLSLRHFNELDHELQARLTRAHRPATKYLAAFNSPIGTIVSENISFYAASFLAVFAMLSIVDEDVLTVEHVLSIMTGLTVAVAVLRSMTPDETLPSDFEDLLTLVVCHTHYLPIDWVGQAHTAKVRKQFEQLFQYGFIGLLQSIISPLVTPYVLYRHIHPKALDIVDFFRNFTVQVVGVGDVCSFAQMDVRKHGNPEWHEENMAEVPNQYSQGENGKVELSLIHFTCTNPSWRPPESAQEFVRNIHDQSSVMASFSVGDFFHNRNLDDSDRPPMGEEERHRLLWQRGESGAASFRRPDIPMYTSGLWRTRATTSLGPGARAEPPPPLHMSGMWRTEGPSPASIRDMSMNATYLHSIHSNRADRNRPRPTTAQETTPLLSTNR